MYLKRYTRHVNNTLQKPSLEFAEESYFSRKFLSLLERAHQMAFYGMIIEDTIVMIARNINNTPGSGFTKQKIQEVTKSCGGLLQSSANSSFQRLGPVCKLQIQNITQKENFCKRLEIGKLAN